MRGFVLALLLLTGCTPKTVTIYETVPVYQVPFSKEQLPKLSQEQRDSIRQDVWNALVKRDELLLLHIRLQNKVIKQHNDNNLAE